MPSTITHAYFANDVYKKLKLKKYIDLDLLKIFSQGPDILFFYYSFNYSKTKKMKKLSEKMHRTNTQDYFYNLISYIKNNKLESNKQVMSYLYGNILHYTLDSTIHPYVFYKTGVYNKNKPHTKKYKGLHSDMEKYIDQYFLSKREKLNINKIKIHKDFFKIKKFNSELNKTIDYTFEKTFKQLNISKYYYKSILIMKSLYYLLRYDPYKIKYYIYTLIDKLLPFFDFNFRTISYAEPSFNKDYYLNIKNKKWNHPCSKKEIYSYSFFDLYDISIKKAIKLINETNKILYENKNTEYSKNIFTNLSYVTGKNCDSNLYSIYYEF